MIHVHSPCRWLAIVALIVVAGAAPTTAPSMPDASPAEPPTTAPATAPTTSPVAIGPVYVRDDAGVFTPQVAADAADALARLDGKFHKQLIVETVSAVPDADRAAVTTAADRATYFRKRMADRAKTVRANGVFVLICLDPKYVEVGAGKETRARGIFTPDDITRLRKQLQRDLHGGRYDAALNGAVGDVARTYAERVKPAGQ